MGAGAWVCVGRFRSFSDGSAMAFLATGTETAVREAHVTWNQSAPEKLTASEKAFVDACETLNRKAAGIGLTTAQKNAIETHQSGQWQQNGIDVSIEIDKESVPSVTCKVGIKR
jgi:hypothetical protein